MIKRILRPFERFFKYEAAGGIALAITTVIAMVWANSGLGPIYESIFHHHFSLGFGKYVLSEPLHFWINDGLMAIFFFLVGMEIKREVLIGELCTFRKAALPVVAALGGMLFPALLYFLFNAGTPEIKGWGIPVATDIAFALGAMSLLGSRIPKGVLVFLTALAIADDIGAVLVIALVYTSDISWIALAVAGALFAALMVGGIFRIRFISFYIIFGALMWFAMLKSGIHPTIAGVLLGATIPARGFGHHGTSLLHILEKALQPWVVFFIMPVFALANAGIKMDFSQLGEVITTPVSLGIILGLFLGKQLGITLFSFAAVKAKLASLPRGVKWHQIYGAAVLGGIGFTMSIFVAQIALDNADTIAVAKISIIAGSLLSAIAGIVFLRLMNPAKVEEEDDLSCEIGEA